MQFASLKGCEVPSSIVRFIGWRSQNAKALGNQNDFRRELTRSYSKTFGDAPL